MLLAALGGALVRSQLYGIEPASPVAHAAAALALVAVVIVASLVPAWRASRANPVDVLRTD
jgi:ABC-type lipoprotein release transport system permease subunit